MTLYLDTADIAEWHDLMPTGLFHGITTNPLLAARAGYSYADINWSDLAQTARDLGAKELHAQVSGAADGYEDWAGMLYETGKSAGIETIVKIPLVDAAIRKTPVIKALGGRILMTACYDAKQMFVAQGLGADFIAPYYGRMIEAGVNAKSHIATMQTLHNRTGCKVLVASLRSAEQMTDLATVGAEIFTIAPAIARALLSDPLTERAFVDFENAAPE